jgi:hypothetical protein
MGKREQVMTPEEAVDLVIQAAEVQNPRGLATDRSTSPRSPPRPPAAEPVCPWLDGRDDLQASPHS